MWAKSPAPAGNTIGKETIRLYDALGRLEKETLSNAGAYTRYEYPANAVQSKVYTTIEDTNNNGADAVDEVMSESWTDGAGRTLMARTLLPGSAGGWSGSLVEYDTLGRVKRSSVPTEVSVNQSTNVWTPAGDDANRGWLWNSQEYDWKSRVTKKINTDGTFQTISYDGCGCAGGQTTTISGEEIFETAFDGTNPVLLGRRTQKIYADVLGRTKMTEVLDWDNSVYSATVPKYNGRDQAVSVKKYAGNSSSSTFQETTMSYDGFGRLKTRHRPEQIDTNNNPTYTTYNYYADGNISSVVDARGAAANYSYNSRGLTDSISYSVPNGSTIPVTPTATFTYDNIGNRTKMTDGLGTVDYTYTNLSQLKTEKRTFNDTLADAPAGGNAFVLSYDYTLSGQLKYITDAYGQQFNYAYDKVGRLQSVVGSTAFDGISTYASNPTYNARGTLTSLQYGSGVSMNITGFNNKLQATGFEVKKGADKYIDKEYKFYEDGSLKFIDDALDEKFDRSYKYDAFGRTTQAKAGVAARGGASTQSLKLDQPYVTDFSYDAFGHITSKEGYYYNSYDVNVYSYNQNDRNPAWSYDAEGSTIADNDADYTYDAAGRIVKTTGRNLDNSLQLDAPTEDHFGGDGLVEKVINNAGSTTSAEVKFYYIRSSVLNKIITEADASGKKKKTFVAANGTTLAVQELVTENNVTTEKLTFNHTDASGTGMQRTDAGGALAGNTAFNRTAEYSPLGRNIAEPGAYISLNTSLPPKNQGGQSYNSGEGYRPGAMVYVMDGQEVPEKFFMDFVESASHGSRLALAEFALRMSSRAVGWRDSGVRWGTPTTITYGIDGSRSVSEGEFNPALREVNYSNPTLIYEYSNTWSAIGLLATQTVNIGDVIIQEVKVDKNGPNKKQQKKIDDASKAVTDILGAGGKCASFFGANALAAFNSISFTTGNFYQEDPNNSKGILNYTVGIQMNISGVDQSAINKGYVTVNSAVINNKGAFFTSNYIGKNSAGNITPKTTPNFGGYSSNTLKSRVIQLLHELGHIVVKDNKRLLSVDGGNATLSEENTNEVKKVCEEEINALKEDN